MESNQRLSRILLIGSGIVSLIFGGIFLFTLPVVILMGFDSPYSKFSVVGLLSIIFFKFKIVPMLISLFSFFFHMSGKYKWSIILSFVSLISVFGINIYTLYGRI